MSKKYSSYMAILFLSLVLGSESQCRQQFTIATSSIGSSSGVATGGSFSASYSLGIPAGGEVSSNLFWTSSGIGPIERFIICPVWICGVSFYDANLNGIQDSAECGIAGRIITLMGPTDTLNVTTDADGGFCFTCPQPGTYTLCQTLPDSAGACKWVTTTLCRTKEITGPWKAFFGSAYSCIGGRSIGYWSNKHGSGLISDADLSALRTFNLRNPNGSNFDPTTINQYQAWLTGAGAQNTAYKLSEHLSALKLNIAHGLTTPTGDVDTGRDLAAMMEYANCLLGNPIGACGGAFAGQNGSVTKAGVLSTEQERVKNIIDKINSSGSFVQPSPCVVAAAGMTAHRSGGEVNEEIVGSSSLPLPTTFALNQNYPNPFNPATIINFQLPVSSYVTLKVYNVLGQEIALLVNEMQEAGYKSIEWNASNIPSGVYFYRLQAGDFVEIGRAHV